MGLAQDFQQNFKSVLSPICLSRNVSIRDVQQIVTHLALLATSFGDIYAPIQTVVYTSLICKVLAPDFYPQLRDGTATFEQFSSFVRGGAPQIGVQAQGMKEIQLAWEHLLVATGSTSADKFGEENYGPLMLKDKRDWLRSTIREHLETFSVPPIPLA